MPRLVINNREYDPCVILFDVDGTLVDDSLRYSQLGKNRYEIFNDLSSKNAAAIWAKLTGLEIEDWTVDKNGPISKAPRRDDLAIASCALYLDGYPWYEARRLAETIYDKADELQEKSYKPRLFNGVREKLVELNDAGFKLGIATNGVTIITEKLLTVLNIRELFTIVVGADLVENSKPAPDMLLYACMQHGYVPSECLYVGDQFTDIKAAENAVILASLGVRNREIIELADEWVDSIDQVKVLDDVSLQ